MKSANCLHGDNDTCVFCAPEKHLEREIAVLRATRPPTFERCADATLEKVRAIYASRGQEYADSWALENMVSTFTKSTLRLFGFNLTDEQIRVLQAAALVDIKDSRMGGPFKEDSVVDGVAYRSLYLTLREEYEAG